MDKKQTTVQELIDQARNTRNMVHEVAAAYVGTTPDKVVISTTKEERGGRVE